MKHLRYLSYELGDLGTKKLTLQEEDEESLGRFIEARAIS